MPRLELTLLGPFCARLGGEPITTFESNKVRAFLAYLAVEAGRPHPRELLAALLWPDRPDASVLANLRFALSDLRQAIGDRQASPPYAYRQVMLLLALSRQRSAAAGAAKRIGRGPG